MNVYPVNELNICSFRGCTSYSEVIVERLIGESKMMFGYCQFHSIIAATLFQPKIKYRFEIHV